MQKKLDIDDQLLISKLEDAYDLFAVKITFLPLGADMNAAVYRVIARDQTPYFLKLQKNINEAALTTMLLLKSLGIEEIIAPLKTKNNQGWVDFLDYKMMLFPFVDGNNRFEKILTNLQKQKLGKAMRAIHAAKIPLSLAIKIPQETFAPAHREIMRKFLMEIEHKNYEEFFAKKLAQFIKSHREEINQLITHAEILAQKLQLKPKDFVLCHTDIHGGNILLGNKDELYIVDWDAPMLAPKERDLMFIGAGIDEIWQNKHDEEMFYLGYQNTQIDREALAYYRYERIIVDLVEFCQQLLLTDEGGADREQAYRWFIYNFEPGRTIDRANKTL